MNHVLCTVHIFKIDTEIRTPFCRWSIKVSASHEVQNAAMEDP